MRKTEIKMNKTVYFGQAILDLSKTLMYEFHYDYMRPKYGSKARLCYMDTNSFVYEVEAEDFYRDIAKDVEKRSDTSGYSKDDNRPLPIGENKKEIGLMKEELGGKIMTEFVALRSQNTFFRMKSKNTVFLHKTIEKPYLNLHYKFRDFFPQNNEDMKILSFGFFTFGT